MFDHLSLIINLFTKNGLILSGTFYLLLNNNKNLNDSITLKSCRVQTVVWELIGKRDIPKSRFQILNSAEEVEYFLTWIRAWHNKFLIVTLFYLHVTIEISLMKFDLVNPSKST